MNIENFNKDCTIIGKVEKCDYDHAAYDEDFYKLVIDIKRLSGTSDKVPVIISGVLLPEDIVGKRVCIKGDLRSYSLKTVEEGQRRHHTYLFARKIQSVDDSVVDDNQIELIGYLCNKRPLRENLSRSEILEFFLAKTRNYKSDYIPCIAWNRTARALDKIESGSLIKIFGRFQSREYMKTFSSGEVKKCTAYEISISHFSVEDKEDYQ